MPDDEIFIDSEADIKTGIYPDYVYTAASFSAPLLLLNRKNKAMENTTEKRVAVISIIVEESDRVNQINEILHSASDYIIGRMGIPYREKDISIISIVIDAPVNVINNVSGKLGRLSGVTAKTAYSKA